MKKVIIMGYLEKGTGKHQSNMVYGSKGICPTIAHVDYKEPKKIVVQDKDNKWVQKDFSNKH